MHRHSLATFSFPNTSSETTTTATDTPPTRSTNTPHHHHRRSPAVAAKFVPDTSAPPVPPIPAAFRHMTLAVVAPAVAKRPQCLRLCSAESIASTASTVSDLGLEEEGWGVDEEDGGIEEFVQRKAEEEGWEVNTRVLRWPLG